jgi:transposase
VITLGTLGNPLRVILSAGQIGDIKCAVKTSAHLPTQAIIADKGCDAEHVIAKIDAAGAQAVFPRRSNRLTQRSFNRHLCRDGSLVERFFARIKHFRRIDTRYDKVASFFL